MTQPATRTTVLVAHPSADLYGSDRAAYLYEAAKISGCDPRIESVTMAGLKDAAMSTGTWRFCGWWPSDCQRLRWLTLTYSASASH